MKDATLGQIEKVSVLIKQKKVSAGHLQTLLERGLLARLFEADPNAIDIGEYCAVLHVENELLPPLPEAVSAWLSKFATLKKRDRELLQLVAGFYDERAAALELLTEAFFRFENSFIRGQIMKKQKIKLDSGEEIEAEVSIGRGVLESFVAAQRFSWTMRIRRKIPHSVHLLKEALRSISLGDGSYTSSLLFGRADPPSGRS